MKKSFHSLMALPMLFVFLLPGRTFATKHIISVQNFSFSPASIPDVAVGDTMRWVWVSGSHTTTSTIIPATAAVWDSPINSTTTSFEYKVAVAGTFNYKCTPHAAMGMVGSFTASTAAATLSVSPSNRNVQSGSGSTSFSVLSNSVWSALSNVSWCTVTASGNGNGTITATYTANPAVSQRVATITVSVDGLPSQLVTVTQAAAAATLLVSPINQDVDSQAGSAIFNVTSNSNWTALSGSSWCTVTPSGSGNGIVTAAFTANSTVLQQVATITVTVAGLPSQQVTVTQAGALPILLVSPTNQDVGYQSGQSGFNVTSNTNWTAVSGSSWCTVTSSGTGNGTITATYSENPTNAGRVATITINVAGLSPKEVTVTQEMSSVSVNASPIKTYSIYPNPAKGPITVTPADLNTQTVEISVLDAIGTTVYHQFKVGSESYSVDLSSLARGNYFVRITSEKGSKVSKILLIN